MSKIGYIISAQIQTGYSGEWEHDRIQKEN